MHTQLLVCFMDEDVDVLAESERNQGLETKHVGFMSSFVAVRPSRLALRLAESD